MPQTKSNGEVHNLYGGALILRYSPNRHMYFINDEYATGVTTVTGRIDKSAPMMGWVAKGISNHLREVLKPGVPLDEVQINNLALHVKTIHRTKSREEADLGTMAHEWVERYIKWKLKLDGYEEPPAMPINPRLLNCVNSFLDWESKHNIFWKCSERKVASLQFHFAGTEDFECYIDMCGKECCSGFLAKGVYVCGDWKSSTGIRIEYHIQTGAYLGAVREESKHLGVDAPSARLLVRFGKDDGIFESRATMDNDGDYLAFLGLLDAHKQLKKLEKVWDKREE